MAKWGWRSPRKIADPIMGQVIRSLERYLIQKDETVTADVEQAVGDAADALGAAENAVQYGALKVDGHLQSQNFVPDVSGWRLSADGALEAGDIKARGEFRTGHWPQPHVAIEDAPPFGAAVIVSGGAATAEPGHIIGVSSPGGGATMDVVGPISDNLNAPMVPANISLTQFGGETGLHLEADNVTVNGVPIGGGGGGSDWSAWRRSSTLSVAAATETVVGVPDWLTGGDLIYSAGSFYFDRTGIYQVFVHVDFGTSGSSGQRSLYVHNASASPSGRVSLASINYTASGTALSMRQGLSGTCSIQAHSGSAYFRPVVYSTSAATVQSATVSALRIG